MDGSNVFANVAGIISVIISGGVAWAVHRSSQEATEKEKQADLAAKRDTTRQDVEKDAFTRARSIYEGTIDQLQETVTERDRTIRSHEDKMRAHEENISGCNKEIERLRRVVEAQGEQIRELREELALYKTA